MTSPCHRATIYGEINIPIKPKIPFPLLTIKSKPEIYYLKTGPTQSSWVITASHK